MQAPAAAGPELLSRLRGLYHKGGADLSSGGEAQSLGPSETVTVKAGDAGSEGLLSFCLQSQVPAGVEQVSAPGMRERADLALAALFEAMEEWREELGIADYSVSHVTLEQVFLTVTQR